MRTNDSDFAQEELSKYVTVRKMIQGTWSDEVVSVVQEVPITIFLNKREIVTLLCTGSHLDALAVGFLKSEGLIDKRHDIQDITLDDRKAQVYITTRKEPVMDKSLPPTRTITSGCGKGIIFYTGIHQALNHKVESSLTVSSNQIFLLMSQLTQQSDLYRETRGVHNVALASPEGILLFRADIGRHNAVDMICGTCFLEDIPMEDKILLTTGRITSEILLKVVKMRMPLLISRHVATYHGVSIAQHTGITLIGDVRGKKFVIYTHPERVKE